MCMIGSVRTTVLAAALAAVTLAAQAASTVPEPDAYRRENFRAPVPATLKGARVVATAEAEALWRENGALFIDVLPRPPKPDLPEGTVWREPPHFDIPGSVWLADVGYGSLSPEMEAWFGESLEKLTGGDKRRPILIYCRSECWMSWNAARRAVEWGYAGVIWYPGGTDEWEAAKLPLEEREPEPRPPRAVVTPAG
jgi:PQQ-dependent catabolism-associated CXXCW motif protein